MARRARTVERRAPTSNTRNLTISPASRRATRATSRFSTSLTAPAALANPSCCIDIDGLKERNDTEGHAAGDELLTAVVAAIRSNLRSYDPLVRIGGDEFLCGFTNTDLEAAQRRVAEIQAAIARQPNAGSITVGLAGRDTSDTLKDITARADANMYARRPTRIPTRRGP